MREIIHRTSVAVSATLVAGLVVLAAPVALAQDNRDCSDFETQAEAQAFFEQEGGPEQDPHMLDLDGDGVACEGLSGGPVSTATPTPATSEVQLSDSTVEGGDSVTATAGGFKPNSEVTGTVSSTQQRNVGSATADASGDVSLRFTVPSGLSVGSHTLELRGVDPQDQTRVASTTFTVTDGLPNNGAFTAILALAGVTFLEAGAGLSLYAGRLRRRQRSSGKRIDTTPPRIDLLPPETPDLLIREPKTAELPLVSEDDYDYLPTPELEEDEIELPLLEDEDDDEDFVPVEDLEISVEDDEPLVLPEADRVSVAESERFSVEGLETSTRPAASEPRPEVVLPVPPLLEPRLERDATTTLRIEALVAPGAPIAPAPASVEAAGADDAEQPFSFSEEAWAAAEEALDDDWTFFTAPSV